MTFELCFLQSPAVSFKCNLKNQALQVHPVLFWRLPQKICEMPRTGLWALWGARQREEGSLFPRFSLGSGSSVGFCFIFVWIVSLRYNLHTIIFTHLNHWVVCVYSVLCNHHHNLISEYFYHLKKKPCTLRSHTSFPHIPQPCSTGNWLSVSTDWLAHSGNFMWMVGCGFCSRFEFFSLSFKPFQWAYSANSPFSSHSASPPAVLSNKFFPVLPLFSCLISLSELPTTEGSLVLILWSPDDFLYSILSSSAMSSPPQSLSSFKKLASATDFFFFLTAFYFLLCVLALTSHASDYGQASFLFWQKPFQWQKTTLIHSFIHSFSLSLSLIERLLLF